MLNDLYILKKPKENKIPRYHFKFLLKLKKAGEEVKA